MKFSTNVHQLEVVTQVKNNDKRWATTAFKLLVYRRNIAWKDGLVDVFKLLRNQANCSRKSLKSQCYHDRIEHLENDRLHNWWHDVEMLLVYPPVIVTFKNITEGNASVDPRILPDTINKFLTSVTEHVSPIEFDASMALDAF